MQLRSCAVAMNFQPFLLPSGQCGQCGQCGWMDFSRLRDIIDTIYKALVRICEGFFFCLSSYYCMSVPLQLLNEKKCPVTSRAWQAGWRKLWKREEPIKTRESLWERARWHGHRLRDLLEVFVLDVSEFSTSLSHAATVFWSGLLLTLSASWTNLSLACCLLAACLDIFFSLTFLPHILARWCHFLLIRLALVNLWFLTASFLLTAQELGPDTPCSSDKSLSLLSSLPCFLHCCFPSASYTLQFPILFTFPTLFNYLLPITSLLS